MDIEKVIYRRNLEKAYRCEDLTPKQLAIVAMNPFDKVASVLMSEVEGILMNKISWENAGSPCIGKVETDI